MSGKSTKRDWMELNKFKSRLDLSKRDDRVTSIFTEVILLHSDQTPGNWTLDTERMVTRESLVMQAGGTGAHSKHVT